MKTQPHFLSSLLLLFLAAAATAGAASAATPLPGDPAPFVQPSRWLRGEPLTGYEPGRVYVVDLWATWCAPCLASMPALHAVETKFGDRVTVIAASVWEMNPAAMQPFLAAHGDIMPAHITADSVPAGREINEGLTSLAFLGTSEHVGIPATYLIGPDGRLAWIGNPDGLEAPLTQVLDGTWDVAAFAAEYAGEMAHEDRYWELFDRVGVAIGEKNWAAAFEACEATAAADTSFAPRVARAGFLSLAELIAHEESVDDATRELSLRAVERALALQEAPHWRAALAAGKVAKAAGRVDLARGYLEQAFRIASDDGKSMIEKALADLPDRD